MMTRSEFDRMLVIGLRGVFFFASLTMLASLIHGAWTFTPTSDVRFNRGTVASAIMMAVFVWVFLDLSLTLGKPEPKWNRTTKPSTMVTLAVQLGLGCAYAWLRFWP